MKTMSDIEQTLSIIKPDAVERNLESEIKKVKKRYKKIIYKFNIFLKTKKKKKNFYKKNTKKPVSTFYLTFVPLGACQFWV